MFDPLALIKEINANYKTTYVSDWCPKCSHITAHLEASTLVPVTGETVKRRECSHCHQGETRLIGVRHV
jgi:hypothetical protein